MPDWRKLGTGGRSTWPQPAGLHHAQIGSQSSFGRIETLLSIQSYRKSVLTSNTLRCHPLASPRPLLTHLDTTQRAVVKGGIGAHKYHASSCLQLLGQKAFADLKGVTASGIATPLSSSPALAVHTCRCRTAYGAVACLA